MTGLSEFYQVAGLEKRQERQKAFNPLLSVFLPFYSIVIYESCVFCCPRLALLKKTLKQTNKTWQDITHTHTRTRTHRERERETQTYREGNRVTFWECFTVRQRGGRSSVAYTHRKHAEARESSLLPATVSAYTDVHLQSAKKLRKHHHENDRPVDKTSPT